MIPAWVLGLGVAVAVTASSYSSLYATESSRREVVRTLGSTPATLALYGRIYADTVGGLVAWRLGGIALALAGLMSILIVVRHTRAEEETGRAELVGAGVVGRHAPLAAALLTAALAGLALGVVVMLGVVATGLSATGALALAPPSPPSPSSSPRSRRPPRRSPSPRAAPTASRSACSARPSRCGRSATPARTGSPGSPRSAGPRPYGAFADERWWLLLALLALAALLTAAATQLAARRDLGAGILPPRPGPARGALTHAAAARLAPAARRARRLGGGLRDRRRRVRQHRPGHRRRDRRQPRGARRATRAWAAARASPTPSSPPPSACSRWSPRATPSRPCCACAARRRAGAPSRCSPPRSRARAGRSATPRSRSPAPRCSCSPPASTAGIAHAAQTGDAGQLPRLVGAALAQVPAAWVLAGLTLALFGFAPRGGRRQLGRARALPRARRARPGARALARRDRPLALRPQPAAPGRRLHRPRPCGSPRCRALGAAGLAGLRRRDIG